MDEITILGAGESGLALAGMLREKHGSLRITLIDKSPIYFNKSNFISSFSRKDFVDLNEWASEKNVHFIHASVERINAGRRKIYFKEREPIQFNAFVIATGLVSKKIAVRGEHREGFFYLYELDPLKLQDLLKISSEATVYISTILGLRLAVTLLSLGKEVKIIAASFDFLREEKARVINFFEKSGTPLYLDVSLEEAIGEGAVKAVKISPLKVFSSQLLFIDSGFLPNCSFFDDPIEVKDSFFSNREGIYFLGDVKRQNPESDNFFVTQSSELRKEASVLCEFLLNGKQPVFEAKVCDEQMRTKVIDSILTIAVPTRNQPS